MDTRVGDGMTGGEYGLIGASIAAICMCGLFLIMTKGRKK